MQTAGQDESDVFGDNQAVALPTLLTVTLGPWPWFVGGLLFVGASIWVSRPMIAALGFAALVTAWVAVGVSFFPSQLVIWGVLSGAFTAMLRGMMPQESAALKPSQYARVCEAIPPGEVGHVQYEGAIWQARCQISDRAIASGLSVIVVKRQGTTLIVLPIPTSPSNSP